MITSINIQLDNKNVSKYIPIPKKANANAPSKTLRPTNEPITPKPSTSKGGSINQERM